jgi:hypothetical protein
LALSYDPAGVLEPVVDHSIVIQPPGFLKRLSEKLGVPTEVRSSRQFCGAERGNVPVGGVVQGPEPEKSKVPSGLGAWDTEP